MFYGDILENIKVGNTKASIDEINKVIEQSQLKEYIDSLPEGINTNIGENGTLVSGGQCQRISIARALLKDSEIVIFDEATSSLDNNEMKIQKQIDLIGKNKTMIIIAHRLSTITNADKICVFNKGEIVEQGTHNELLKNSKIYYELIKEQLS